MLVILFESHIAHLSRTHTHTHTCHSIYLQREVEQHEHKLTLLYTLTLKDQLAARLRAGLEAAGVMATVIEGPAGVCMCFFGGGSYL